MCDEFEFLYSLIKNFRVVNHSSRSEIDFLYGRISGCLVTSLRHSVITIAEYHALNAKLDRAFEVVSLTSVFA